MTMHIDMAEATRLTRLGKLTEAIALLRGDRPVEASQATPVMGGCIEMTQTSGGAWSMAGQPAQETPVPPLKPAKPRVDLKYLVGRCRAPVKTGHLRSAIPEGATFSDHILEDGPAGRHYKLYVPSTFTREPAALILMLHGCTQSPDDFAAGTGMNALAEQHGFLVLYPEQSASANMNRCWNWFNERDQRRGQGEPDLLVRTVKQAMACYAVDRGKVFVAGLSAGGAMAAILGARYPDVFAGVAVHSGLAVGAAHDMPSAFAAMNQGTQPLAPAGSTGSPPTIVFHGDADRTVHGRNGQQVVDQVLAGRTLHAMTTSGQSVAGRRYSRTVYENADGSSAVEHWVLHGAGHAWSGGQLSGSYTDPSGPDASREMVRFFGDVGTAQDRK